MNFITAYANESNWVKTWQREYKYGIFLIFPPEPHLSTITAIRNKYAWSQSSQCNAHISLSVQVPQGVTQEHIDEMQSRLFNIDPIYIKYGPVVDKPQHPGVVLEISPQKQLKSLLEIVESNSVFIGSIKRKYEYWAHMTIAEMLSWEQTFQIIDQVKDLPLGGEFNLEYISYAVPDETFEFTERARIYLGKNKQ
jgi:hypothetical protein